MEVKEPSLANRGVLMGWLMMVSSGGRVKDHIINEKALLFPLSLDRSPVVGQVKKACTKVEQGLGPSISVSLIPFPSCIRVL